MFRLFFFWFLYFYWFFSILILVFEIFRICVIIEVKYWMDVFENFSVDYDILMR